MLTPIHTIDLLYYKRMFWHLNKKANFNKEEEDQLTQNFVYSFTERAFAFVEEIFNSNNSFHLDSLSDIVREQKFEGEIVSYVETEIAKLREKAQSCGWDHRIKIKVTERKIGNAFQTLSYSMDLDATSDALQEEGVVEVYESAFTESDIVDNPSAEQLNEWFTENATKKKTRDS